MPLSRRASGEREKEHYRHIDKQARTRARSAHRRDAPQVPEHIELRRILQHHKAGRPAKPQALASTRLPADIFVWLLGG